MIKRNLRLVADSKATETINNAAAHLISVGEQYRKLLQSFEDFQEFLIQSGAPIIGECQRQHEWWLSQSDYELGLALHCQTGPFHELIGMHGSGLGELLSSIPKSNRPSQFDDSIPF